MNKTTMSQSKARDNKKRTIYDVHYLWYLFTHNKRWFALSFVLCMCCAAVYIYFARPAYRVSGKMLITEKKSSSSSSAAGILLQSQLPFNLGSSLGGAIGVENEKEILKSKLLARQVVNSLGLYTEYRHYKYFKGRLLYKSQPVNVSVSQELLDFMDDNLPMKSYMITLSIYKDDEGYRVKGRLKENKKKTDIPEQAFTSFPAVIKTGIGQLTLTENKSLTPQQARLFSDDYREDVEILPPMTAARKFSQRLSVASASKKAANTLSLNIQDESIMRGIDFINTLVVEYNDFSTKEKHKEVSKYDEYVKERLAKVDAELGLKDEDWESFKKQNGVTDLKVDAEEVVKKKSEYEAQLVGIGIQKQLLDYLKEYVDDPDNSYEIIPVNMGVFARSSVSASVNSTVDVSPSSVSTGDAVNVISRHNALVTERNMLLKSSTEKSPQVMQLTDMIDELHPIMQKALARDIKALQLRSDGLEKEYGRYMGRVGSAPQQERILTEITRDRKVKEGVYISLLQKREENVMDLLNTVDKGRLTDATLYNGKAAPKLWLVLLIALLAAILIPYISLFAHRILKRTIDDYDDLKSLARFPVVGVLPREDGKDSSSFQILRNNLLHQLAGNQKVIMMTSYGEGEGKTHVSTRLAETLFGMGKKVVVCDLNLYHPSLGKVHGSGWCGLVLNGCVSQENVMSAIELFASGSGVDVLGAGDIHDTTPANLVAHDLLKSILAVLRDAYDFVILDTPAMGQHGEMLIDGLADVTCIVSRYHKTKKTEVEYMNQLGETGRLSCPLFICLDNGTK